MPRGFAQRVAPGLASSKAQRLPAPVASACCLPACPGPVGVCLARRACPGARLPARPGGGGGGAPPARLGLCARGWPRPGCSACLPAQGHKFVAFVASSRRRCCWPWLSSRLALPGRLPSSVRRLGGCPKFGQRRLVACPPARPPVAQPPARPARPPARGGGACPPPVRRGPPCPSPAAGRLPVALPPARLPACLPGSSLACRRLPACPPAAAQGGGGSAPPAWGGGVRPFARLPVPRLPSSPAQRWVSFFGACPAQGSGLPPVTVCLPACAAQAPPPGARGRGGGGARPGGVSSPLLEVWAPARGLARRPVQPDPAPRW